MIFDQLQEGDEIFLDATAGRPASFWRKQFIV
jgi:hypothetical protein